MISHWPTFFLLIGYPVYWIELFLFAHPDGHATWLAGILFLIVSLCFFSRQRFSFRGVIDHRVLWIPLALAAFIMLVAVLASVLPPHLPQEFDVLNYHLTLPRQHWLTGSFSHLPWSSADLFLLPVDFALAPFWLATELPNKFPQFIFFLMLPFMVGSLTRQLGGSLLQAWMAGFLVLAAHGIGVQAGTAMLDVVLCYLALAAIDSLLRGNVVLAAMELAFFVFAKPAMPLLCFILGLSVWALFWMGKKSGVIMDWHWGFLPEASKPATGSIRKFWGVFLVAALVVGGPFMVKSFYYSGTPFYPLGAGYFKPLAIQTDEHYQEIMLRASQHMTVKDQYGASRGFWDFVTHFWWVAVPEKGVNNRFDYPLGLPILLMIIPFIYFIFRSLSKRHFSLLPWVAVVYWSLWWMGTQQARFLFVPMILVMMATVLALPRVSRILWICVMMALGLTALSVWRAHAGDMGKAPEQVLRAYDHELLNWPAAAGSGVVIDVPSPDAAFAPFKVDVKKEYGFYVLTP